MTESLSFNPAFQVEIVEPDTLFFFSERSSGWLTGPIYPQLAALIDGRRDTEQLLDALLPLATQGIDTTQDPGRLLERVVTIGVEARRALEQLERGGLLLRQPLRLAAPVAAFCHHLGLAQDEVARRLASTTISIESLGSVPAWELAEELAALGVQLGERGDLHVVLVDGYLDPRLAEVNRAALADLRPWLLAKPLGTTSWIGPIFDPPRRACWSCLAKRLRDNLPAESFVERHGGTSITAPPLGALASSRRAALGLLATEIFKWVAQGGHPQLESNLVVQDWISLGAEDHPVTKRPQCPACESSTAASRHKPSPVVLGHRKKRFTEDGGHRVCSPAETLARLAPQVSPITGVIRELVKLRSDERVHTYVAKHHFFTVFDDLENLQRNLGGRSSGKGKTDLQARASGACEAIERYCGVFQGDEPWERRRFYELGERAIHPNQCMGFSERQYRERQAWNARPGGWFQRVPAPFDPERERHWTPVWSLTRREPRYLPTALCYYGYRDDFEPDCWADSNGCAAGNTLEEAILQGLMELVERDAVALWWYNRVRRPALDLDSFDDPHVQAMRRYYHGLGREAWVLDITSDLGIPTFAAITRRRERAVEDIVLGYGTHFDPAIALSRALTEVNQVLPNVDGERPDGTTSYPEYADPVAIEWWRTASASDHPYLVPDAAAPARRAHELRGGVTGDLLEDIEQCRRILEGKGLELLVLDQSRPDIDLRVAKVIVPGLRHMWRRLGPGRLYDVPVALGWQPTPSSEDALNPIPMWM